MTNFTERRLIAKKELEEVKEIWDNAPAGAKKDEASLYYSAAEAAHAMNMNKKCVAQLAKVREMLS